MNLYDLLLAPFAEFDFMHYALASVFCLSLSAAPVGVFLVMRRMSLIGDALSHAVLPGAAVGYMFAGLSLPAMGVGGFAAGMLMALLAGLVSRFTTLKEDANFAAFYLSSLAIGVILISKNGSSVDLLHLLFGSVLAVDIPALQLIAAVSGLTLITLAVIYRPLVLESIDPLFLKSVNGKGGLWHVVFLILVVMNLVSGFQALGILMSVGLMMLPAITARLWARNMGTLILLSVLIALFCGLIGLLISYHIEIPSASPSSSVAASFISFPSYSAKKAASCPNGSKTTATTPPDPASRLNKQAACFTIMNVMLYHRKTVMKHLKLTLIAALLATAATAAPLPVVTSFSILGDVAKQIGGQRVAVQSLVGANQDTHAYHMTSGDIKKIRSAKLVLLNGLGLEAADIQRAVKQSKVSYAEATKGIQPLKAEEEGGHHHDHDHDHEGHHHDHGEYDPHVWNDPVLMSDYAQNVAEALIKADPEGKVYYQQRLGNYQMQLKKLHSDAQAAFNAVPAAKRKVLTGHDAFSYMGNRYNISFIAPQGVSSEAEPSAKQVAAIIRQIKREGIKAVFTENIKDTRMVDRIAKETGVNVSGKLYSDALGNAPADTYIGMYRHNVKALTNAMKQ